MNSKNYAAGLIPGESIFSVTKGLCVFLGTTKTGRVKYRKPDGKEVSGHDWWFMPNTSEKNLTAEERAIRYGKVWK